MRSLKSLIMMNLKFRYQSKCSFREENTMLELSFKHKGTVNVPCDLPVKILICQSKVNEIMVLVI
jgi:hypothetical protein